MPGLAQRNEQFSNGSSQSYSLSSTNGFWSKQRDDVSYTQLQKFWNELAPQARQELLRIDKQTLFEQARKNMYCSRCNGLLLEGFLQIVMYGKSLQQEVSSGQLARPGASSDLDCEESSVVNGCQDEIQDPSVHPWGGLTTSRDGSLTLMDCYLYSKSLKGLQNVFDSARARERERELLYPDACGGGGRGWISQGIVGYGRGHGTRETCALHTARLSCDTLVDFWSALGEETRQSLLRMKEEDFIERLMYRFDSKRFCRDCRRNVIREFKELKELKRMRRETRCTSSFCVADTAFEYEVSDDTVYADWHNTFVDAAGTYHHFEWAVGTGEGKADILEFENVGMNENVTVDGLDLGGVSACFITLRAWKLDGRCTELSVKAHALKGGQCVHCRLVVGDSFVTITRGENIRRFFEHAEEAEEEEDDDSMDKDGNDLDGECSRPQKHAKSPELAREFLLDAATVIFKEQVEKAFREGTARQNAHSIFVCLALKLLEERVHVACKEIITLEKQMKLLEEEEKEKREEEERKERRRTKEREKKLRRKERLKGKEKDKDKNSCEPNQPPSLPDGLDRKSPSVEAEAKKNSIDRCDSVEKTETKTYYGMKPILGTSTGEITQYVRRRPKGVPLDEYLQWTERRRNAAVAENADLQSSSEINCSVESDVVPPDVYSNSMHLRLLKARAEAGAEAEAKAKAKANAYANVNGNANDVKSGEKLQSSGNGRVSDRYDYSCSCNQSTEYRPKVEPLVSAVKVRQETKSGNKSESVLDNHRLLFPGIRTNQADQTRDNCGRPKSKFILGNPSARDFHSKKVWEPLESKKKYHPSSNSESDVTQSFASKADDGPEANNGLIKPSDGLCSGKNSDTSCKTDEDDDNDSKDSATSTCESELAGQNRIHPEEEEKDQSLSSKVDENHEISDPITSLSSSSDNCSSCLSDGGDSNTASSNLGNNDSSSTSDSEDSSLQSEGKESPDLTTAKISTGAEKSKSPSPSLGDLLGVPPHNNNNGFVVSPMNGFSSVHHQNILASPMIHNQTVPFPVFQTPSSLGFYHQTPISWQPPPPFSHPNQYLYAGPIGYGLQYNPVQHIAAAAPLYTAAPPLPFYQPPVSKSSPASPSLEDQARIAKPRGPTQLAPIGDGDGFSLFHFGGPVALSTGCPPPEPPPEEIVGDFSSKCSAGLDNNNNGGGCRKKSAEVEEYNLFAASNGIRFSFF